MIDYLLSINPYGLKQNEKDTLLLAYYNELLSFHYNNCYEYKKIIDYFSPKFKNYNTIQEVPFIPVRLFKYYDLLSVDKKNIVKILTSSGTSSQLVSKIFLDKDNVSIQTKVLNQIISSFIGKNRLPLLLLDTEKIKKDRSIYSARGAGLIGFSLFGKEIQYVLNDNMELELEKIFSFIKKHENETILLFGYTYIIWQYVVNFLEKNNITLNINNAILFHIGGWKKIKEQSVTTKEYNERVKKCFGNVKIYNYYGMVEQLGSVFVECEYGHMHCSNYSDIIIRNAKDFSICDIHQKGVIQLFSLLPKSYPGNILLTEDEGEILGIDDCLCGRYGKYFKIHGRIKNAELRGCSDTYERN